MLSADLIRCAIIAGMTVVASAGGSAYIVYVLAVTSTVGSSSYTPAQAALTRPLVDSPDALTAANLVGNTGYGWLNTAMGVGSVAGAAIVAVALAARRRLAGGFALGILLWGAVAVAAAVSTLAPALVLLGLVGTAAILVQVNSITLLQ